MGSSVIGLDARELDTPALLVDLDKMERNIARTASIFREMGVGWRPHTKGQKVPAIAHLEIKAGAIGITCAKLGEAEVMAANGIDNILIANQVVGQQKVTRLANLCQRATVITAVDSIENVEELDAAGQAVGVRIPVVVEVDIGVHRCGVDPGEPAVALSREVHRRPGLRYVGLMGYEGHAREIKDPAEREAEVHRSVGLLVDSAERCRAADLPVEIVSCGGTGIELISGRVPGVTEIEAGGIIFNDMYYTGMGLDREYALTVLSTVTSRPTPTRIVTDAGRKTMQRDIAIPKPKDLAGVISVGLSAEHGQIELDAPNDDITVGDTLEWIVGYGDTTICLHDELYGTRGGRVEVVWPILARGKLR
jgi:D-serine deaminase-like pyridoxal phosphate-dependent protein